MWDMHAHVIPPAVIEAARAGLYGLSLEAEWLLVDGGRMLVRNMANLERLTRYAEDSQLSLLLSVPPLLIRDRESHLGDWSRFLNDAMSQLCRDLTIKAAMLAILPLATPALALQEWERVQDTAWGVVMTSGIQGELFTRDRFRGFWGGFGASGGGMVWIHGGSGSDPRLGDYYLDNLVGFPGEDTLAAAALIFSGLAGQYPDIQWGLSHGGGSAAFLLGRWQRGYETGRPGLDTTLPSPNAAFSELWFDSVVHDASALALLMDKAPGHVVFGTDYPFPMGIQQQLRDGSIPAAVLNTLADNGEHLIQRVTKGRLIP